MLSPPEKKINAYANEKLIFSLSLLHTHTHTHTQVLDFGSFWPKEKAAMCPIFGHIQLSQDGGLSTKQYFIWFDSAINCSVVSSD